MNISAPFIHRPVATFLLALGLFLTGLVAVRFLPVAPLPSVDIPTIVVFAGRPGADPETMAASIAAPLERRLGEIPGVSCVEPRGALYCFPRLDPEVYPILDDEAFVIDLLRAKKILVTHGTGFNWFEPDHFRLVTLPDVEVLTEAIGRIADYLETLRA